MIHVFHGEDAFSMTEAVRRIVEAAGPPDLRDSNMTQFDASDFSKDRFENAAMVMPFLAPRRVVITRGLLGAAEGQRTGRRGRKAAASEARPGAGLPELATQLPPTTDAIFVDGKLNNTNPLLAALRELGKERVTIREFAVLQRDALVDWIRNRAAKKGAQIDGRAIALLADQVGANLWALDMEMEKLSIYAMGRAITVEDVQTLVFTAREVSVFELVDAIMDRRADVAMTLLDRMAREGATTASTMNMLARQARLLALAQDLARRKVPRDDWGPYLGAPFVVRKTAEQARRFTPEAVRGFYQLLIATELAMKTGETTDELAMTEFLARASALASAGRGR